MNALEEPRGKGLAPGPHSPELPLTVPSQGTIPANPKTPGVCVIKIRGFREQSRGDSVKGPGLEALWLRSVLGWRR